MCIFWLTAVVVEAEAVQWVDKISEGALLSGCFREKASAKLPSSLNQCINVLYLIQSKVFLEGCVSWPLAVITQESAQGYLRQLV